MKYLVRIIFFLCLTVVFACSNGGGTSSVKTRMRPDYRDFHIYYGTAEGAKEKILDTVRIEVKKKTVVVGGITMEVPYKDTIPLNLDSLYAAQVGVHYFSSQYATIADRYSRVKFEFIDDGNMLSYVGPVSKNNSSGNVKIISSYNFEGDKLYVLKDGDEPVLVARKVEGKDEYYRTLAVFKSELENEEGESVASAIEMDEDEVLDLNAALKKAGFNSRKDFTNPEDTIVWCNVRYTFR